MLRFRKPMIPAISLVTLLMLAGCGSGGSDSAKPDPTPTAKKANTGATTAPATQPAAQPGGNTPPPDKNNEGG